MIELQEIANELEKYPFFEKQGITGKFVNDLAEKVTYKFCEAGDKLVNFGEEHDVMYMILDGVVDISFDLLNDKITETHIREIGRDLEIPFAQLHRDIDLYKMENHLT